MAKALKIIVVIVIVAALGVMVFLGAGDAGVVLKNSWTPPDYQTEGSIVEGLGAYDLFTQALDNYNNANNFAHVFSLDFKAGLLPIVLASQQTIEIVKYQEGKVFKQVTKQGTGLGEVYEGSRFYFDGTNGYEVVDTTEDRFPELGDEDWTGLEFAPFSSENETAIEKAEDILNFSSYVIDEDNLSPSHNDKVYLLDGKYYISITINCLGIQTGTIQKSVEDAIMGALGDNIIPDTLVWKADSVLTLEISKIDGNYYITASSLYEKYTAKQAGTNINTGGEQTTSGTYAYTSAAATITSEELLKLA